MNNINLHSKIIKFLDFFLRIGMYVIFFEIVIAIWRGSWDSVLYSLSIWAILFLVKFVYGLWLLRKGLL